MLPAVFLVRTSLDFSFNSLQLQVGRAPCSVTFPKYNIILISIAFIATV